MVKTSVVVVIVKSTQYIDIFIIIVIFRDIVELIRISWTYFPTRLLLLLTILLLLLLNTRFLTTFIIMIVFTYEWLFTVTMISLLLNSTAKVADKNNSKYYNSNWIYVCLDIWIIVCVIISMLINLFFVVILLLDCMLDKVKSIE